MNAKVVHMNARLRGEARARMRATPGISISKTAAVSGATGDLVRMLTEQMRSKVKAAMPSEIEFCGEVYRVQVLGFQAVVDVQGTDGESVLSGVFGVDLR